MFQKNITTKDKYILHLTNCFQWVKQIWWATCEKFCIKLQMKSDFIEMFNQLYKI